MVLDFTKNFWKEFPELQFAPEMCDLYNGDKTKNRAKSSKIMWGLKMCEDPQSKFFNRPNKYQEIQEKFIKDDKFKFEENPKLIQSYRSSALTDAERAMIDWNEMMILRNASMMELYVKTMEGLELKDEDGKFIERVVDTKKLKDIDVMMGNTPKMFEEYKKIKEYFDNDQTLKKGKNKITYSEEI